MKTLTLTVEITDADFEKIRKTLEHATDNDSMLGLRVKDVDGTPEHVLSPQVYVTPLSFEVE